MYITGDFNFPKIDWEHGSTTLDESEEMLMRFIDSNFLSQIVREPTRSPNILDLVITNKPDYVVETNITTTPLSDHMLVEVVLGCNLLAEDTQPSNIHQETDKFSFRAVNCHETDFNGMNEELSSIDWEELYQLCENDTEGSLFLELFRPVVINLFKPKISDLDLMRPPGKRRSKSTREKYTLKRRRRKRNAQISTLRQENPTSQRLPKLIEEVNLLAFDISEAIISDLDAREAKAVGSVKSNPRYFYSYAKRFSKTKSTVAPLRSADAKTGTILYHPRLENADGLAPNHIKMVFREHSRLGIRTTPPPLNNKAQISVRTDYENSFKMNASRLWNLLPKSINIVTSLEAFKVALGEYLRRIPDTPPVPGYTAVNRNSLLDWSNEKGGRT
ncbi:unnamed protein product [Boreogadus saida]